MINLFIASGNLGHDMEVKYTPNGKCIGTFSLPVKSGWGENEKTAWVRCKVLGDRAEKLAQFLTRGLKVTVHGRFEVEEWDDKDGVHHMIPCIVVDNVDLPAKSSEPVAPPRPNALHAKLTPEQLEDLNDDIPF